MHTAAMTAPKGVQKKPNIKNFTKYTKSGWDLEEPGEGAAPNGVRAYVHKNSHKYLSRNSQSTTSSA